MSKSDCKSRNTWKMVTDSKWVILAKHKADRLRDEFDVHCPICYESFYKSPRLLDCGHSICNDCVVNMNSARTSSSVGDQHSRKEGDELAKQRDEKKKLFEEAERKLNRLQSPKMRFVARIINRVNNALKNPISTVCCALFTLRMVILVLVCFWFMCMFVIIANIDPMKIFPPSSSNNMCLKKLID